MTAPDRQYDPKFLHPEGALTLELSAGTPSTGDGFVAYLNNYGYESDPADPMLHILMAGTEEGDPRTGILIGQDWANVTLIGQPGTSSFTVNLDNVNYILNRAGWSQAIAHSASVEAERAVLGGGLNALDIERVERYWGADGGAPTAPAAAAPARPSAAAPSQPPAAPSPASSAPAVPAPALRASPPPAAVPGDPNVGILLDIIERRLLNQPGADRQAVQDELARAGYQVAAETRYSIVR